MPERFTVVGGLGFIGRHVVEEVRRQRFEVMVTHRNTELGDDYLGHVIYCAGVTGDFLTRRLDTMRAHACALAEIIDRNNWDSLLYLSSTRVYYGSPDTRETTPLTVRPMDPLQLYNISKLAGEALCLSDNRPTVRVARLSNVFGHDDSANFLPSILRSAARSGQITLHTALESERDYVSVNDVAALLPKIALHARERIYNVASGWNTTTNELLNAIVSKIACRVEVGPDAPITRWTPISVERLGSEFPWSPRPVADAIPQLLAMYSQEWSTSK